MSDLREKLESAKSGAESLYAFCEGEWYQDLAKAIRDTLADVIKVLNPSLDENGLARCGCGGKAEIVKTYDENSWTNIVHVACKKCKIHITFTAPAELSGTDALKEDAKVAWNRAMNIKETTHET